MDARRATAECCLCHGTVVTPEAISTSPLIMRGGRVVLWSGVRTYEVNLRDHLIFPGLINAHDHLHVNVVPPLREGPPFRNSYAWIAAFQAHFKDPAVEAALALPKSLRLRHGALKNLLAGTTFVAHHDPRHAAMEDTDFPVGVLREYGWSYALGWSGYGPPVRQSFAETPVDEPWLIHLAEGTDATAQAELEQLDRLGCLASNSVLIHGVGLSERDIERIVEAGAAVVWCPSSNHALLGRTLDPHRLHRAGRLALGTDARVSGARDLLAEMTGVAAREELAPHDLLGLVTTQAARILRKPSRGHLAPGAHADMVIVEDRGGDPVCGLVGLSRRDLRAVVRDGKPRLADPDFAEWFAEAGVDAVPVVLDGKSKLMDRTLADPALLTLEEGLDLLDTGSSDACQDAFEARYS